MIDTPLTNREVIYANRHQGNDPHRIVCLNIVSAEFARYLELDNRRLREALTQILNSESPEDMYETAKLALNEK